MEECPAASRERIPEDVAVCGDGRIDLITREKEQPRGRLPDDPTFATRDRQGHPPVPTDLSLDRAHIVDSRFDLDDDETTCPRVECEKVDPSVRPAVDDLDLAKREPAIRAKASVRIPGAPRVSELPLSLTEEDRRGPDDPQFEAEGVPDPLHDLERRVRSSRFDRRHVSR